MQYQAYNFDKRPRDQMSQLQQPTAQKGKDDGLMSIDQGKKKIVPEIIEKYDLKTKK